MDKTEQTNIQNKRIFSLPPSPPTPFFLFFSIFFGALFFYVKEKTKFNFKDNFENVENYFIEHASYEDFMKNSLKSKVRKSVKR